MAQRRPSSVRASVSPMRNISFTDASAASSSMPWASADPYACTIVASARA
jgi:hypothetical protein